MIRPSIWTALLLGTMFGSVLPATAALVIDATTPYTQDFDFLTDRDRNAWVDLAPIESPNGSPGWLWQSDGGDQPYRRSAGGSSTGSPYAFGESNSDERAMGNLGGGDNDNTAWGLLLQNGGAKPLISVDVAFTAEQWRSGSTTSSDEGVTLMYRLSSTPVTDLEIAAGDAPSGWIEVPSLSFGVISTSGSGAVDGNSAAFRDELTATLTLDVPAGQYLALRWYDGDDSGFDYGFGIDDLTVRVAAIPEPTASLFGAILTGVFGLTLGRRPADT